MNIFSKFKKALVKSSNKISSGIDYIFLKEKLDNNTLQDLEDLLIQADMGSLVARQLVEKLAAVKFDKNITAQLVKEKLAEEIEQILSAASCRNFELTETGLNIILLCGVNGSGKTTTIGKLAAIFHQENKKVAVAACDTFRAAAVEQLVDWAEAANVLLIKGETSADPASVAYKAAIQSISDSVDILFIDTAGRLHNHQNLMDELNKIVRVLKKANQTAPHHSLLVIDSTIGQNIYNQVEQFSNIANITGLIITKLDGTAKAGAVVGVTKKFGLPIYFVGDGEKISDLKKFDSKAFSRAIVGL